MVYSYSTRRRRFQTGVRNVWVSFASASVHEWKCHSARTRPKQGGAVFVTTRPTEFPSSWVLLYPVPPPRKPISRSVRERRSGDNSSVATALRKPYPIARIADVRLVHHQLIHDGTSRGFHRGLESVSWAFGSPSGSGPQDLHTESGTPKRNGGSIFEQTYRV